MMGGWNTGSGASIHAEFIGREWIKKGVELSVFSFYDYSFHGKVFTKSPDKEESYVTRCFTKYGYPEPKLDTSAILEQDFEIFVVQDLGMLPISRLASIFPEIKKRARTVNIIHDGELSKKTGFFNFDWDHVVCFDTRYYEFLKKAYPENLLSIIPYPAAPLMRGNRIKARERLDLPQDKKIIFIFGQAAEKAARIYPVLNKLSEKYDIFLMVVSKIEKTINAFKDIASDIRFQLKIIEEAPGMNGLYEYLHSADCTIYNKRSEPVVVVASSIFQCLGSDCPVIALNSNFVDFFENEIIKYKDEYELESSIIDVFEKGDKYQKQQKALEEYLKNNSSSVVAGKFLELFKKLREENGLKKI